jgi:hypothetical protein
MPETECSVSVKTCLSLISFTTQRTVISIMGQAQQGSQDLHSRVTGTDAEAAHQQLSSFFQHVPDFALSFLYQLLICLAEYKNIYFQNRNGNS